MPAYNAEEFVKDCLDSLIRQTYKNIEIILIDDGSIDLTGEICDIYQRQYESLVKVEHCNHGGVSNARLLGAQKAIGKYVVFVDADDWIENDYISEMLSHMEGADIVAAGISRELMNEKGSIICEYNSISAGKYETNAERQELYGKMLYSGAPYQFGVLPYICNKMFRKELIQFLLEKINKCIFDGEDAVLLYQYLLLSRKIVLTDGCKYHYVNHNNSASFSDSKEAYINATYIYQELYACFVESEYYETLLMQLDYYIRRMIWKKDPAAYLRVNSFLFPYNKIEPDTRIILYGMGKAGNAFYQEISQTRYCKVIAWADKNPRCIIGVDDTVPKILPEEIKDYSFKYVVIAVQNRNTLCKISEELIYLGIDRQKIVIPDL